MAADDKRIANGQGGYNCGVYVDPKNPDIVYTFQVTAYRSTDGGKSFTGFKGGPPGGDDPQVMWIDPTNGKRMLMSYDQGAIVSFDGGDTWSSWYNQSTEQVYHIATDNSFPYWIYATQQDAGAIATRSRGNLGAITPIDWKPVPGWEWGTILPDPRDPNVVFSSGLGISKITYPGEEWIKIGPDQDPSLKLRGVFNPPIAFAMWNRTRDYGNTWTRIVTGLPATLPGGAFARVVRADPKRRGLLFAGTESAVYVSFDDGDNWQSLMLNLPTTEYRDIAIHDNDLIVGTYGRGIWVLDDFAVLRQLNGAAATEPAHLFKPSDAVRVRRNVMYNTPFPREVPQAPNPPDGAIMYYSLGAKPLSEITIEVLDARGSVVRRMSSAPPRAVRETARPPMESSWLAPGRGLPANVGLNRANWDLRYDPPPAFAHSFEFNGNPGVTPMAPEGPLALPGLYTIRLTVDGKHYTQPLTVERDPRSRVSRAAVAAQHALVMRLYAGLEATWADFMPVAGLRGAVTTLAAGDTASEVGKAAKTLATRLDSLAGDSLSDAREVWQPRPTAWSFVALNGEFALELNAQDNADHAPTQATLAVARSNCDELRNLVRRWRQVVRLDLATFNRTLERHGMTTLAVTSAPEKLCSP